MHWLTPRTHSPTHHSRTDSHINLLICAEAGEGLARCHQLGHHGCIDVGALALSVRAKRAAIVGAWKEEGGAARRHAGMGGSGEGQGGHIWAGQVRARRAVCEWAGQVRARVAICFRFFFGHPARSCFTTLLAWYFLLNPMNPHTSSSYSASGHTTGRTSEPACLCLHAVVCSCGCGCVFLGVHEWVWVRFPLCGCLQLCMHAHTSMHRFRT